MRLRNNYFLLRHGQTVYQTKKKDSIYPPFPEKPAIKLTKKGEKQIKVAARKLKRQKIDLIFSSDLFRTRQSAEIVAKELGLKIHFDKRLRDINLGIYRGEKKEKFYQVFPRDSKEFFYQRPSQGENWQDCQKRMVNFLKSLEKKYRNKNILIVSHSDPLWLLEGAVKNWSPDKMLKIKTEKRNYIETGELRKL